MGELLDQIQPLTLLALLTLENGTQIYQKQNLEVINLEDFRLMLKEEGVKTVKEMESSELKCIFLQMYLSNVIYVKAIDLIEKRLK